MCVCVCVYVCVCVRTCIRVCVCLCAGGEGAGGKGRSKKWQEYLELPTPHEVLPLKKETGKCVCVWMDGWMDGSMYVCMYVRMFCLCRNDLLLHSGAAAYWREAIPLFL